MNNKQIGTDGENIAVRFLEKQGYKILERNFTTRTGEIDIIAEDGGTIVFAEVKTRSSDRFGLPRESVTLAKQRKYSVIAQSYLLSRRQTDAPARFDVIDIYGGVVTHIKNAFDFAGR